MADPTLWPDYAACRRCHAEAWSRDGACPACGHPMRPYDSNGGGADDGHPSPGSLRDLAGMTVQARADMPPDVQAELDGNAESLRETRRHGRRWVRVLLDGVHLYLTGPLPPGAKQHKEGTVPDLTPEQQAALGDLQAFCLALKAAERWDREADAFVYDMHGTRWASSQIPLLFRPQENGTILASVEHRKVKIDIYVTTEDSDATP